MEIVKKLIKDLKPTDYNPRLISKENLENLKTSISEFGYASPIIWNKRTGNIVGGHQRLKILKEMGETEVDVSVVDLPLSKEKAFNIILNNPRGQGSWDNEALIDILKSMDNEHLKLTGFDTGEIADLIKDEDGELEKLKAKEVSFLAKTKKCPKCGHEY